MAKKEKLVLQKKPGDAFLDFRGKRVTPLATVKGDMTTVIYFTKDVHGNIVVYSNCNVHKNQRPVNSLTSKMVDLLVKLREEKRI